MVQVEGFPQIGVLVTSSLLLGGVVSRFVITSFNGGAQPLLYGRATPILDQTIFLVSSVIAVISACTEGNNYDDHLDLRIFFVKAAVGSLVTSVALNILFKSIIS